LMNHTQTPQQNLQDRSPGARRGVVGNVKPPSAYRLILPVWGDAYLQGFLKYCLPSLLAPGNLPAVVSRADLVVHIFTKTADREPLDAADLVQRLRTFAQVEVTTLPSQEQSGGYDYFSSCYKAGLERAKVRGEAALLLTADQIWADGAISAVCARIEEGAQAVMVAGPRLLEETALPALDAFRGPDGNFDDRLDSRALATLAWEHLHPWDRSLFWDESDRGRPASFLFWEVPGGGFLMHCLHLHPVCIRLDESANLHFTHTVDGGDFVERTVGHPEACHVIRDSDEAMYCSTAPRGQSAHLLDQPKVDWLGYANWALAMGISQMNVAFLGQGIRFLLQDFEQEKWASIETRADSVCARIRSRLDQPHLLLYSRIYFALDRRFGRLLRSHAGVVRFWKRLRRVLGVDF